MKTIYKLLILLAVLLIIAHATRAQDITFRLGNSALSILSSTSVLEMRDDGIIKYNGKIIDTSKAACQAFQDILSKRDSIQESQLYGWAYMVRVPAIIHKHRCDGYIAKTEDHCKKLFAYGTGHEWQYYYNKGYRIVKVRIYEY